MLLGAGGAAGEDVIKIGVIIPLTGTRGPISIDPRTSDIVQNIYIRKIEKVNGEPLAIEFATFEAVKDSL
jgi:hypothetical protein